MSPLQPDFVETLPAISLQQLDETDVCATYRAVYEAHTYRFLLPSGDVIDVEATRDDSDLRKAVLDVTKASRICGVTRVIE